MSADGPDFISFQMEKQRDICKVLEGRQSYHTNRGREAQVSHTKITKQITQNKNHIADNDKHKITKEITKKTKSKSR